MNEQNRSTTLPEDDADTSKHVAAITLYKILYYIKNQQDVTFAVLLISNWKITLHVSDAFCVHHQ